MATFVHHGVDKIGALALTLALVGIAAPAKASPVTPTSPAVARSNVFVLDEMPNIGGLARLGIGFRVTGVATEVVSPLRLADARAGAFDFTRAQAVALEWAEATIRGPGSHAFGLVGWMLWLLWWRRLPAPHS